MKRLLVVDDDETFRTTLGRALQRRGYAVDLAADADEAMAALRAHVYDGAIVDLRMPGPTGLELIANLRHSAPAMAILMLTGFASIATAVEAVKRGATNYLPKPANADEILAALFGAGLPVAISPASQPLSVDRLEWEHIQKVLADCEGNISATARALNMHRRTLQRKLAKRPVAK